MTDSLRDALAAKPFCGEHPERRLGCPYCDADQIALDLLAAHPVEPAGVSDEAVAEVAGRMFDGDLVRQPQRVQDRVWRDARAALGAALPHMQAQPECGAVDRSGQRRCVFTPGHHEAENWTSHGDRGGWTWNDQPAED